MAEKAKSFHRQLHALMDLERWQRNDIAAMEHDVRAEFNFWLGEGEKLLLQHNKSLLAAV